MKKVVRGVSILLLSVVVVAIAAGAAQAAAYVDAGCWADDGDKGGSSCNAVWRSTTSGKRVSYGYFQAKGEVVGAGDVAEDGRGVAIRVGVHYPGGIEYHYFYMTRGSGLGDERDFSIPDGYKVDLKFCQYTKSHDWINCASRTATA